MYEYLSAFFNIPHTIYGVTRSPHYIKEIRFYYARPSF